MTGYVAEEHSDLTGRVGDAVKRVPPEVRDAPAGLELEHQTQCRRLAGTGRAEEGSSEALPGLERDIVDGGRLVSAVGAGQSDGLEHRFSRGS
jgi:hypothetical protein